MPTSTGRTEAGSLGTRGFDRTLYRLGAVVGVVGIAAAIFDIVLSMMPGWGGATVPASAAAWLQQMATNPLLGLRNLDLLNVTVSIIMLPMFLALYGMLRDRRPGLALTGVVLAMVGATLFAASNAALPMLELARQYTAAGAVERTQLVAAATGLLARGAHGSYGALPGFLLSEIGTLLVALGMARASIGRGVAGWLGVAGATALLAYSITATFAPVPAEMLTALAAPGGLLVLAWQVTVVRQLWELGRARDAAVASDEVRAAATAPAV